MAPSVGLSELKVNPKRKNISSAAKSSQLVFFGGGERGSADVRLDLSFRVC